MKIWSAVILLFLVFVLYEGHCALNYLFGKEKSSKKYNSITANIYAIAYIFIFGMLDIKGIPTRSLLSFSIGLLLFQIYPILCDKCDDYIDDGSTIAICEIILWLVISVAIACGI